LRWNKPFPRVRVWRYLRCSPPRLPQRKDAAMNPDVIKSLARLMQQTAVKQAVQECALHRLLALLPAAQAAEVAVGLKADAAQVMDAFSAGVDQPSIDATITAELNAMLQALGDAA
jgi:dihydrodipicolinate synthase/N-acetylneuraminate lyase